MSLAMASKQCWTEKMMAGILLLFLKLETEIEIEIVYSSLSSIYLFQLLTRLKEFSSICNLLMFINHEWQISLNVFSLLGWSQAFIF